MLKRKTVTGVNGHRMSKILKIESCLNCPHHTVVRDPSSEDSFDWQDEALVCKLAAPAAPHTDNAKRFSWPPCRIVVGASRCAEREYKQDGEVIPKWCPLEESTPLLVKE